MMQADVFDGIILGINDSDPPKMQIINASQGDVFAILETGHLPMALLRRPSGELILSDHPRAGQGIGPAQLSVLDFNQNLALKYQLPLPDRIGYSSFTPGMMLSQDQRSLYYLKRISCHSGPWCDDYSVGVIDLDFAAETAVVPLPRNAGYPLLTPYQSSGVLAMCPVIGAIFPISSRGEVVAAMHFDRYDLDIGTGTGYLAWPVYGGQVGIDQLVIIFEDGGVQVMNWASATIWKGSLLPGTQFRFNGMQRWRLDDHRVLLGFAAGRSDVMSGAVVFDAATPGVIQLLPLPSGTTHLAPMAADRVAVLHSSRLSVLDLKSLQLVYGPFKLAHGTDFLIA